MDSFIRPPVLVKRSWELCASCGLCSATSTKVDVSSWISKKRLTLYTFFWNWKNIMGMGSEHVFHFQPVQQSIRLIGEENNNTCWSIIQRIKLRSCSFHLWYTVNPRKHSFGLTGKHICSTLVLTSNHPEGGGMKLIKLISSA